MELLANPLILSTSPLYFAEKNLVQFGERHIIPYYATHCLRDGHALVQINRYTLELYILPVFMHHFGLLES